MKEEEFAPSFAIGEKTNVQKNTEKNQLSNAYFFWSFDNFDNCNLEKKTKIKSNNADTKKVEDWFSDFNSVNLKTDQGDKTNTEEKN